ncbi:hypothetical protein [Breoghania sp.]|uniref:tyrosine-type recombinase/integrase n=1 Tax=Breoghania sp. TaxID=2065378 RepID=UPI002AA6C880|nr:hypothetical protein [Breoghania sp.]
MSNTKVSLPYCVWRDGRPRFVPSPALRKLGYKSKDLKDHRGNWYSLTDTVRFSEAIAEEVEIKREAITSLKGKRKRHHSFEQKQSRNDILVSDILQKWRAAQDLAQHPVEKTRDWYRKNVELLEKAEPEIWNMPVNRLRRPDAYDLYERFLHQRGLPMSRALISTMRRCWSWSANKGYVTNNPFSGLRMQTPKPRLRVGTIKEMQILVSVADEIGRPEIGDSIVLALFTGQRQGDRLCLVEDSRREGWVRLRQSKTGTLVAIPELPELSARLAAGRERRAGWKVAYPHILIDEVKGQPWHPSGDHYRKVFACVRDAAAKRHPSLKGFRDQDLRDTAVTWLANAGCTVPEICSITGHSIVSANTIMKHYLAATDDQANSAIAKLSRWIETKGGLLSDGEQSDNDEAT